MIQNTGKGGLYRYYCCSNKLKKGPTACRGQRTPMERLDEIVVGEVARHVLAPDRLTAMLDAYVTSAAAQAEGAKAKLTKLRHDQTAAAAGIARLLELVEKGLMDAEDPAMRERLVTLKLQRDQIAKEIADLQERMASSTPTITTEKGRPDRWPATRQALQRARRVPPSLRPIAPGRSPDHRPGNPHQRAQVHPGKMRRRRERRTRAESSLFCSRVARPERFELPTPRFVVWCSIQLSYGREPRFRKNLWPGAEGRPLASFPGRGKLRPPGGPATRGRGARRRHPEAPCGLEIPGQARPRRRRKKSVDVPRRPEYGPRAFGRS